MINHPQAIARLARRCIYAFLLLTLSFISAYARDNYPRVTALDVLHYRINLAISASNDEIAVETEILFTINEGGIKEVPLDLVGLAVDGVFENGKTARFSRSEGKLNVILAGRYRAGNRLRLLVKYHGQPTDGLFLRRNKFGRRTVAANNWPDRARYWIPSIDHPYDKATVDFHITAPGAYLVLANRVLVATTENRDGKKIWHWREESPIPVYCMVVAISDYEVVKVGEWKGIPLTYILFPQDAETGKKALGRSLQMFEMFSDMIGPYPYKKLALVEAFVPFGAMENASNIFLDQNSFKEGQTQEGTTAHEMVHQWFGNSITVADWHHIWLSEGFATYLSFVFFERTDGAAALQRRMADAKQIYLGATITNAKPVVNTEITDYLRLINRNNYEKGAWILHMLRHLMGDEKFFIGLRRYYETFKGKNVLTVDFQKAMESQAGRSLEWFFQQWVYEPGYPIYDVTWSWNSNEKQLRVNVAQQQEKPVFRMPIDIEIKTGEVVRRETIEINQRAQSFTFNAESKPTSLAIDPGEHVLKTLKLREEMPAAARPAYFRSNSKSVTTPIPDRFLNLS